jgi:hypothetical protein
MAVRKEISERLGESDPSGQAVSSMTADEQLNSLVSDWLSGGTALSLPALAEGAGGDIAMFGFSALAGGVVLDLLMEQVLSSSLDLLLPGVGIIFSLFRLNRKNKRARAQIRASVERSAEQSLLEFANTTEQALRKLVSDSFAELKKSVLPHITNEIDGIAAEVAEIQARVTDNRQKTEEYVQYATLRQHLLEDGAKRVQQLS